MVHTLKYLFWSEKASVLTPNHEQICLWPLGTSELHESTRVEHGPKLEEIMVVDLYKKIINNNNNYYYYYYLVCPRMYMYCSWWSRRIFPGRIMVMVYNCKKYGQSLSVMNLF